MHSETNYFAVSDQLEKVVINDLYASEDRLTNKMAYCLDERIKKLDLIVNEDRK